MDNHIIIEELPAENKPPESPSAPVHTEGIEHLIIASHFNIDTPNKTEDGKLREIWEHARSLSKVGSAQDIIWQIINLQRSLGAPRLGESPLDKVYRWAKLKRQQQHIEEELRNV